MIRLVHKPSDNKEDIRKMVMSLDHRCFPQDKRCEFENNYWWFLYNRKKVIAYCSMMFIDRGGLVGYFTRVGVLKNYRGRGLQRKLIKARINYAKRKGADRVVTYTLCSNTSSSNNLIACKFKTYKPTIMWAGEDCIYWQRMLN